MNVFQVAHGIYPASQAGTEIYTAQLATELNRQGVTVDVAIPANPQVAKLEAERRLPNYVRPVRLVPGGRWGNKPRYLTGRVPLWREKLRERIARTKPDVIHIHHAIGFGLSLLEEVASHDIPVVLTLSDYWLLCPGIVRHCQGHIERCARECCDDVRLVRSSQTLAHAYLLARRRRVRRFVNRVRPMLAAISESTRIVFEEAGFKSDRLFTHTWGIDIESLRGPFPSATASGKRPRVAYIGSVRPHKGCHILAAAFRRVADRASLHFYGGGDEGYIRQLREQCNGLDAQFYGRFDHAEVGRILHQSDLVVVPSVWEETYCLVAQEAMAARKPVIASNVGGMADRIVHGVNGFLVPPGDAVRLGDELSRVIANLSEITASLDFDRCALDIREDARLWILLYDRMVRQR